MIHMQYTEKPPEMSQSRALIYSGWHACFAGLASLWRPNICDDKDWP